MTHARQLFGSSFDWFLAFLLVSFLPIAVPASIGAGAEHAFFNAWRFLPVIALALGFGFAIYNLIRGPRALWPLALAWATWFTIVCLNNLELPWDSVVEYARVNDLAYAHHGFWRGYIAGINNYLLGYPPGASLTVVWGRAIGMRNYNNANTLVILFWLWSWLPRIAKQTGRSSSAYVFSLFFLAGEQLHWHYEVFMNNIIYAIVWAMFVMAAILEEELPIWQLLGYSLVLIWLRPHVGLAAVPIVSYGLGRAILGQKLHTVALMTLACIAVTIAGEKWWEVQRAHLETAQRAHLQSLYVEVAKDQDPHLVSIDLGKPTSTETTRRRSAWKVGGEALVWGVKTSVQAYPFTYVLLLVAVAIGAYASFSSGQKRRGLLMMIPLLTPLATIAGTFAFALVWADYKSIPGSFTRLQQAMALSLGAVGIIVEQRLRELTRPES